MSMLQSLPSYGEKYQKKQSPMGLGRHCDNARWCRLDQQVSQQLDEVEMTEVICLERYLEAIISQRMRRAKYTSIENENIQWTKVIRTHTHN